MESPARGHRDNEGELRRLSNQLQRALSELQRYKEHKDDFDRHVAATQAELQQKHRENVMLTTKLRKAENALGQLEECDDGVSMSIPHTLFRKNRKLSETLSRYQNRGDKSPSASGKVRSKRIRPMLTVLSSEHNRRLGRTRMTWAYRPYSLLMLFTQRILFLGAEVQALASGSQTS